MGARQFWLMPLLSAEGGAGGGAGGGGAGGGQGGGAPSAPPLVQAAAEGGKPAGQDAPTSGGAPVGGEGTLPAAYWPEGLPETFAGYKGANDRETIDKLVGEMKGQPRPPAKPDDYKLALPEEFTKRFGDLSGDEVVPIWRKVAHKNGLNETQFNGAIAELYSELSAKGLIDEPIDVQTELDKLAPKHGDPATRKAQASVRINGVASNITGLITRGVLSKTEGNIVLSLAARAEGVIALEKMFKALGAEHGLQNGGGGGGGANIEDLKTQMADERYDTRSPKFDAKFRERVDREWREAHKPR